MKNRYALGILVVLLFGIAGAFLFSRPSIASVIFAISLILGPVKVGEDFYDLIDKHLDRTIGPDEKLSNWWHLAYSAALAIGVFVIWPMLATILIETSGLRLREWYEFLRPLDTRTTWMLYPRYALEIGETAALFVFIGYWLEYGLTIVREKYEEAQRGKPEQQQ